MAKYYGAVGFAKTEEIRPGVNSEKITEIHYRGDVLQNIRKLENANQVNDNITVSNRISIVADAYAEQNFHSIRYAEYMGARWKVLTVEVQRPRLIMTLGGVWNGKQA